MAKYNIVSTEWVSPSLTSGTLQNLGDATLEVSTEQVENSGLKISKNQLLSFEGTIFVRTVGESDGVFTVVPFRVSGKGGGGDYILPTASDVVKGGVKIGSGLVMDGEVLSATEFTYSSSEVYTGKWADGKNLYQRTVLVNTPEVILTPQLVYDTRQIGIDTLVYFSGIVNTDSGYYSIKSSYSEIGRVGIELWYSGNGFKMIVSHDSVTNADVYLTFRYTKIENNA